MASTAAPDGRISVCIPCFNGERYLGEALDSVRAQTRDDWEVVLVEDGSRDGAEALVRSFAESVPNRVRYLRNDPNLGLPATRNRAARDARGEFIAMLDADDLWEPDHLDNAVRTLDATGADAAFSATVLFESGSGDVESVRQPRADEVDDPAVGLFRRCFLTTTASVLRRTALFEIGLHDPSIRYCDDLDMWLRLLRRGKRIAYTGKATALYRQHGQAMTRRELEMTLYRALVYSRHRDWGSIPGSVRRKRIARTLWRAADIVGPHDARLGRRLRMEAWRCRLGLGPRSPELLMNVLRNGNLPANAAGAGSGAGA